MKNLSEFNQAFDFAYNNLVGFAAPPIEIDEKSFYLTKAEFQIVEQLIPFYEKDETVRNQLRAIAAQSKINYDAGLNSNLTVLKYHTNSKFFEVPEGVWNITAEYVNSNIEVVPLPIDEFNRSIKNPFRNPNSNKAWRLDISDTISTTAKNVREIVYPGTITDYTIRYLKEPLPIILEDITTPGLTIMGQTSSMMCRLSSDLHQKIVDLAANLAKIDIMGGIPQQQKEN